MFAASNRDAELRAHGQTQSRRRPEGTIGVTLRQRERDQGLETRDSIRQRVACRPRSYRRRLQHLESWLSSVYLHEGFSRSHGDGFLLGVARIRLQNFQGGLPGRHSAKDNSKERSVAIDAGSTGLACGRDNRQAFFPVHLLDNSDLL